MPPYIGNAFTRTNVEVLSLFRYLIMVASESLPNNTPKVATIHRYSYTWKSVKPRFFLLHHAYRRIGLTLDDGLNTNRLYNRSRLILYYKETRRNCQIAKLRALPAFPDVLVAILCVWCMRRPLCSARAPGRSRTRYTALIHG